MKKQILIIWALLAGVVGTLHAQQDAEYSMYMFNGLFLNPAYAGSKDALALNAIYRHQWAGLEGAPRSFSFGAHTPMKRDQYALGILVTHDQMGTRKFNSLYGSFAYRPKLGEKVRLSLGIQFGFSHFNPSFETLRTNQPVSGDAAFQGAPNLTLPNVGFGTMVYSNRFYVGLSVPHILNNSLVQKLKVNGSASNEARQFQHYFFTTGYVIGKETAKVKFKPSMLVKYVPQTPVDIDFTLAFLIRDRFWVAGSYRTGGNRESDSNLGPGESIIGMFEMKITQQLAMGYAYDFPLSRLRSANSGTHEFFMGYEFSFNKKRFIHPRYINYF